MNDEILKMACKRAAMIELAALPDDDSPELDYEFSARFERKMKKLIKYARKKEKHPSLSYTLYSLRRVVLIALVALILLTGCMSIKEIREPIISFFVETFERFTLVTFPSSDNPADEPEFEYITPSVPNGYSIVATEKLTELYELELKNKNGEIIKYTQFDPGGATLSLDTEDTKTENVIINGLTILKYSKGESNYLFWTDEKYAYTLVGTCDFPVLFDIIKEISKK